MTPPRVRVAARPAPRVRALITWAQRRLAHGGVHFGHGTDNARDEAAWLVGGALGWSPQTLARRLARRASAAQREAVRALVTRRLHTRLPAAYLLRTAWFAGLPFYVDERVLVPRSLLGEFLPEGLAPWIDPGKTRRVLDLCTGSGCIAVAAARAFPRARVDAAEISPAALAVAHLNVKRHRLQRRVRLIESDLFAALGRHRYDLILCNPPYVADRELARLPREYRHEPRAALAAGADGLRVLRRLLREAARHLAPAGLLVVEAGGARARLETAFPRIPFLWLTSATGEESVFVLSAGQLRPAARAA